MASKSGGPVVNPNTELSLEQALVLAWGLGNALAPQTSELNAHQKSLVGAAFDLAVQGQSRAQTVRTLLRAGEESSNAAGPAEKAPRRN